MPEDRPGDAWEALPWAWAAVFHVTVLASLAIALVDEQRTGPAWAVVALGVLLMAWHEVGLRLAGGPPETWRPRAPARLGVLLVDIALWFVLVNLSLAFYLALFGLVLQIFRHLPVRQAAVAVALTTCAIIIEQVGGIDQVSATDSTPWLAALIAVAVLGLGGWMGAVIKQSTDRRELIARLEAAQQQLADAEHRAGVLEERARLAREIHDTLAQGFVSIVLHLEAAEEAGCENPAGARRHLDRARTTARTSLGQARRVVQDLRPPQLDDQPVHEAIHDWALRWGDEVGIDVSAETTGEPVPLTHGAEVTLLRAAQEVLHNVRRHASASQIRVTVSYMGDVVVLDVHDDGVGLGRAAPSPGGGFGLTAMRERVDDQGGSVDVESEPGEGTTVAVTLPTSAPTSGDS